MSNTGEIEQYVKDPHLLLQLCQEVVKRLGSGTANGETAAMEAQLREIARTIDRLTKLNVPVPEVLRSEKIRLATALDVCTETTQPFKILFDGFEKILKDLMPRIGNHPEPTVKKKPASKQSRALKTPRTVLRKLIIEALSQLGGSATKRDLYRRIENNYEGKFLPGDFEHLPDGKRIAWQNYSDWEGTLMRKEGLLKTDSPRGTWEFSGDRK